MSELSDELNQLSHKACSLEQAFDIFDIIADKEDIAFGFPRDGCYARAHIMCDILSDMGFSPLKAWAFERKSGDPLTVECDDGSTVKWWYHVAMALPITQEDSTIEQMVFDPSLFDGPVTLEEWGNIMDAPKDKLEIVGYNTPAKGHRGCYNPFESIDTNTSKKAQQTMEEYLTLQSTEQRTVFASQSRQQYVEQQSSQEIPHGKTWKTSEKQFNMVQQTRKNQIGQAVGNKYKKRIFEND